MKYWLARQPSINPYKARCISIRRDCARLSSWGHDLCALSEVGYGCGKTSIQVLIEDSLKYHRLHPEYVHTRIEKLQSLYGLRILLLVCDVVSQKEAWHCLVLIKCFKTEHQGYIRDLTKVYFLGINNSLLCPADMPHQ